MGRSLPLFSDVKPCLYLKAKEGLEKLTDNDIGRLPSKLAHDPLEAGLLADLGRAVHVLNGEEGAQAEQKDLGQGSHQLGLIG